MRKKSKTLWVRAISSVATENSVELHTNKLMKDYVIHEQKGYHTGLNLPKTRLKGFIWKWPVEKYVACDAGVIFNETFDYPGFRCRHLGLKFSLAPTLRSYRIQDGGLTRKCALACPKYACNAGQRIYRGIHQISA